MFPVFSLFCLWRFFCFFFLVLGPPIGHGFSFYSAPVYKGGRKELTGMFLSPLTLRAAGASSCQSPGKRPSCLSKRLAAAFLRSGIGDSMGSPQVACCPAITISRAPFASPPRWMVMSNCPLASPVFLLVSTTNLVPTSCLEKLVKISRVLMSSSCTLCHQGIYCRIPWWGAHQQRSWGLPSRGHMCGPNPRRPLCVSRVCASGGFCPGFNNRLIPVAQG